MKALVLSGGFGTRLRPLSHSIPKQLVPVANEPVLFHGLRALRQAGIRDVGIIVSASDTAVRAAVGDGSRFDIDVAYIPQEEPRGLADCVVLAQAFLGDANFVMFLGDNVFADGVGQQLAAFRRNRPAAQLTVTKVANPSQYGIVEADGDGRVTGLQEKPELPASDLAITGAYVFTPQIHEAVRHIEPSWRNEWEITDAVHWLVRQGRDVRAEVLSGFWKDTGTPADLLECNRVLLERITTDVRGTVDPASAIIGQVVIGEGARVSRSTITGPVVVGAGCVVEDSRVGPHTALGAGCELRDADVRDSILLEGALVNGVRGVHASVIGQAVELRRGTENSECNRYLVGDHSRIEVS